MANTLPIPKYLAHKPIYVVTDYEDIDGPYVGATDAKGLSLGLAQWDNSDVALKVWRHTGNKWSRQSEELPPHRAIDLTILYCLSRLMHVNKSQTAKAQHGSFKIEASLDKDGRSQSDLGRLLRVIDIHNEEMQSTIRDRLNALNGILDEMKRTGLL